MDEDFFEGSGGQLNITILGAPGVGKGTQSKNLAKHYDIIHISTGDILRNEMKQKTKIGLEIYEGMNNGVFVSDEMITELLIKKFEKEDISKGFVLDGYPRNIKQAKILSEIQKLVKVVSVEVPDNAILERMAGRYVCSKCGEVYNVNHRPPKISFTCDGCNEKLVKRHDDKEKTVLERLKTYRKVTEPVKEFYKKEGNLVCVSGVGDILDVTNDIVLALGDV